MRLPRPPGHGRPERPVAAGRVAATVVAVCALAGPLTACERPTPLVTMQSGGNFVQTRAAQYQRDGTIIENDVTPPRLEAKPGARVNVDVPTSVADRGYFLSANNERITEVINSPHYGLTLPNAVGSVTVVVFQAPIGDTENASGSWPFQIVISN